MRQPKKTPSDKRVQAKALRARATLARNVRAHIDRRFRQHTYVSDRANALAKTAGVGTSTVMRILNQRRSASLDTIERIAQALKVPVHTLLMPPAKGS